MCQIDERGQNLNEQKEGKMQNQWIVYLVMD